MAYDDAKLHRGRRYAGMRVGASHDWDYVDGRWRETKVSPDQWAFEFRSRKQRRRVAPAGTGAPEGTNYHWFLLAHQRVRKLDENAYSTMMEGMKWKVAHRRPSWPRWSSEYAEGTPARDRVIEILEETARAMRAQKDARLPRIENALDADVLRDVSTSTLDEFG